MLFLQIWGGLFYLLNKVFFSFSERTKDKTRRQWRVASWTSYLIGLPAVAAILLFEHNWLFAALELGGVPAMFIGLVTAIRGKGNEPVWLRYIAIFAIALGFCASLYEFRGITTTNQWLEVGAVTGFLVGTYLLAKENAFGYLWYMLMNLSAGTLLWLEHYQWFAAQQGISLLFVIDAFRFGKRRRGIP